MRRDPLKHTAQRATLRIKLHRPLIKFNYKGPIYVRAQHLAQLTKMQPNGFMYKG
jgi:hypothetical protein